MVTNTSPTVPTCPIGPEIILDPHSLYAGVRGLGPVVRATTPNQMDVWIVHRHEEARALLGDRRLSKDLHKALDTVLPADSTEVANLRSLTPAVRDILLAIDPPDHTRLRRLVNGSFTPRRVEKMRPSIERMAEEILAGIAHQEHVDLMEEFARPLTDRVNCALLGMPLPDAPKLREWAAVLAALSVETPENCRAASEALEQYLVELVAARRAAPGDDLTSALIAGRDSDGGLTEKELLSLICVLYIAASDTTPNLIGNGTLALLQHPDQLAKLRANPELLPTAVEELIRYDGPIHLASFRHTVEPLEIGGVTIPAGEVVVIPLLAANRDPERFADPDRLDLTRPPNGQLGFGHGIHHCVGAGLGRLVAEIAFEKLFERFPALRLDVPATELSWQFNLQNRGLQALPVRLS
jgi:cytochrome P450